MSLFHDPLLLEGPGKRQVIVSKDCIWVFKRYQKYLDKIKELIHYNIACDTFVGDKLGFDYGGSYDEAGNFVTTPFYIKTFPRLYLNVKGVEVKYGKF